MVGKTLDHYQIVEELGRGAMGQVYLAREPELGRQVALKILPPSWWRTSCPPALRAASRARSPR